MIIPIQNIYYLLCYAWDTLEERGIVHVQQDECKSYADLFARVLESGVTHLLKRGLDRGTPVRVLIYCDFTTYGIIPAPMCGAMACRVTGGL